MTATDDLRRLLDERGVEYTDRDMFGKHVFHWGVPLHGAMYTDAGEWTELTVENATPAQAIDATLGRGTCHAVFEVDAMSEDERVGEFVCSECGETFGDGRDQRPNYCPNCGRKVEP